MTKLKTTVALAGLMSLAMLPSATFADTVVANVDTSIASVSDAGNNSTNAGSIAAAVENTDVPPPLPQLDGPPPLPVPDGPPPLPELAYYIGVDGSKVGPLNRTELAEHVKSGDLSQETLVWTKGMEGWKKAAVREDLKPLLAKKTAKIIETQKPFDAKAYVVGTWTISGTPTIDGLGETEIQGEQVVTSDGRYKIQATALLVNPVAELRDIGATGPIRIASSGQGTYTLSKVSASGFDITTVGSFQAQDLNGLGMQMSEASATETGSIQIIGPNSYTDSEGIIYTRK